MYGYSAPMPPQPNSSALRPLQQPSLDVALRYNSPVLDLALRLTLLPTAPLPLPLPSPSSSLSPLSSSPSFALFAPSPPPPTLLPSRSFNFAVKAVNLSRRNPPPPRLFGRLRSPASGVPDLATGLEPGRPEPPPSLPAPAPYLPALVPGRRKSIPVPLALRCDVGDPPEDGSCGVGGVIIRKLGTAPAVWVLTTTLPPLALLRAEREEEREAALELRLVAERGMGMEEWWDEVRARERVEDAAAVGSGGGERL